LEEKSKDDKTRQKRAKEAIQKFSSCNSSTRGGSDGLKPLPGPGGP